MQLIITARREPLRHRLNALVIAGTDQARDIKWVHLSARFMTQAIQKRLGQRPSSSSQSEIMPVMVGPPKTDHP
jgi:hypothetical protein